MWVIILCKGANQIDAQVLIKYLGIWNGSSQRDHVSIGLFVSQRTQSPQSKATQFGSASFTSLF